MLIASVIARLASTISITAFATRRRATNSGALLPAVAAHQQHGRH
jgi:hypothetical protein